MKINKISELPKDSATILEGGTEKRTTRPLDELVIGLVSSVGTNLESITIKIKERLALYRFRSSEVRISKDVIVPLTDERDYLSDYQRIDDLMTKGNGLRKDSDCNHILALGAIAKINEIRSDMQYSSSNIKGVAYIINSIKHPEEVHKLREVYGAGFLLLVCFQMSSVDLIICIKIKAFLREMQES
ncbi:hypothetical protein [Raoultella ornithinolytica]|uniref:hypothetical protein n=1 Tax=Raoultella ornithinolytica TaxID=54291 RepID=UPI002155946A|nr:hypothetical protein [Raoultella ornithinolytica]